MSIYNLQDPYGITTVRISKPATTGYRKRGEALPQLELVEAITKLGLSFRSGSLDRNVQLSGEDGVQSHIRWSDAYVCCGHPSIGELFKLVSLFVGLQTLDPDLHYQPAHMIDTNQKLRRPVIIYGDPEPYMPLYNFIMHLHKDLGTVRQNPATLIRFASNPRELEDVILQEIPAENSIHGHGATPEEIAEKTRFYNENTYFEPKNKIAKPDFSVVTYTSASKESSEAYDLAVFLAENGIGCVSGAGSAGNMGLIARGSHAAGGYSYGTNCPHIAAQEGIPEGMVVKITPCIYTRMADMKDNANAIICGAGGFGGAGTLQEFLAASLLLINRDKLMLNGVNGSAKGKPIILDNSRGMWEGIDKVMEPFGLKKGAGYHVANSAQEVMELTLSAQKSELISLVTKNLLLR